MQRRSDVEAKFNKSRHNLLLVLAFSAVNVMLTAVGAGISFLFFRNVSHAFGWSRSIVVR